MKMNLKDMSNEDIIVVEKVEWEWNNWVVVKQSYRQNWEGNDKVFSLEKEYFNLDNQEGLTDFIRYFMNEAYNKRWTDNVYVLRWAWHKEPDEVRDIYDKQTWNYE